MIFDVMIRKKEPNENGKPVYEVFRCSNVHLSKILRKVQDNGDYVFSVIPLFTKRKDEKNEEERDGIKDE